MSSTPPRYSAPDPSRQRLRLVAAIGLLACTALVVGGLVQLLSDSRPAVAPVPAPATASAPASPPPSPAAHDSLDTLVMEVERAERAVAQARAALQRARTRGEIDAGQLDWLERRLDALVGAAPAREAGRSTPLDPPRDL